MEKKQETQVEAKTENSFAVSSQKLLVAGAHFGHQTRRWNPNMRKFIYTSKKGVHVINLSKTIQRTQAAYDFLKAVSEKGGDVIFVGTKKQAKAAIKTQAERCGAMYVCERWLGGTLTNFRTIKNNFRRMLEIEKMEKEGIFSKLTKKEVIGLQKEQAKLNKLLGGIRRMRYMPKAIFVVDQNIEMNAVLEAKKLGIPVISIVDTNANPDIIDFPIPANDDAVKSIELFSTLMADAINEGKGIKPIIAYTEDPEIKFAPRKPKENNDKRFGESRQKRDGYKPRWENNKNKLQNKRRIESKKEANPDPNTKMNTQKNTSIIKPKTTDVKRKIDQVKSKVDQVTTKVKEVTTKVNQVKTEINKAKTEVAKAKDEVVKAKAEVAKAKAEVAKAKDEVAKVKTPSEKSKKIDFSSMKLIELKNYAKELGYTGYSSLKKENLINFIKNGGK